MLPAPQVAVRPSSRSGSKQENHEEFLNSGDPVDNSDTKQDKSRDGLNSMGDDLNAQNETHMNHLDKSESDEDDDDQDDSPNRRAGRGQATVLLSSPSPGTSFWASASRPTSPGIPDNASEASSVMPISQQNAAAAKKKENIIIFRIGKLERDVVSLESLLDKLSSKMDLPRGARFIFNMDGAQIMNLEDLEDGGWYVVSSFKSFKVS
ncbi:hypothetical protein U1Q18_045611 [Sarracenia purpurea var. burkii]